mgnify:CR=1 FL=1
MVQIFFDLIRLCIHTAFHIGNCVFISSVIEGAFIMDQAAVLFLFIIGVHGLDIIPSIGLISQGPE